MDTAPVIELEGLTKRYPGSNVDALHDVSLAVREGQIFGFLGPNGAGKSTTITMLVDLMGPTSGRIKIFGKEDRGLAGLAIRRDVGYLTGDMALDKALTGWQQLEYIGHLRGHFNKTYARELAKRLDCDLAKKIKSLSRGNRQKVGLIAALMHKPKLLILDEPTSSLDPLIQIEFNNILLEHKKAGGTTFISSHVLSEVQELCDQVAIIRKGRLVANKPLIEIVSEAPKQVRFTTNAKNPTQYVKGLKGLSELKTNGGVSFTYKGNADRLAKALAKTPLTDLTITDTDLEEIFRKYYEGDNHA
jgi:ABC-2 type transport system ATP-binding protein